MSTPTVDQPRHFDGRFDVKHRTEPAVSLAAPDEVITAGSLRNWVKLRVTTGGSLAGSCLSLTDLSGLDLPGADLATADLWATNFDGADMPGANLADCDARGASFRGTHMPGVNLCGTDLTGARFDDGTNLNGVLSDERTQWPAGFIAPEAPTPVPVEA